jgi:hypothetical protein
MNISMHIERRTFLRGLGTAMALPFMESALPRSLWAAGAAPAKPPLRMAFLFIPNGAHMPAWTPEIEGADFKLPATLEPLEKVRDKLLVLTGLAHDTGFAHGDGAGDHARSAATFLTGVHPIKTDGKGIRAGVSVDQLAAERLGRETRFASLELGCEEGKLAGSCDSGYSCAYSNNISWRSPTEPAGKEVNPRQLFDRLFGTSDEYEKTQSRAKRDLERIILSSRTPAACAASSAKTTPASSRSISPECARSRSGSRTLARAYLLTIKSLVPAAPRKISPSTPG